MDKKKAVSEATEAKSDANHYKQQMDKLRQDLENEKKDKEDMLGNLRTLIPGIGPRTTTRAKKSDEQ